MAYSYFDYEGTGTTIQTDILCVSTEHMYALKVLSEEKSNITLSDVALAATFTKNDAGVLCELKTAPSTKIRVIRSTPYDVLMHDFSNGAQFNADSVDEVYEQLLYLCQEIVEGKLIMDSSGKFGGTAAGSGGGSVMIATDERHGIVKLYQTASGHESAIDGALSVRGAKALADKSSKWQSLTGVPDSFKPSEHRHGWAEIDDKPSKFTPAAHKHTWADITGAPEWVLKSAYDEKIAALEARLAALENPAGG